MNINAACKDHNIQCCYFITSIGSHPMVRIVLGYIVSWGSIHECEKVDKILLDSGFTPICQKELID
jgi:hypothetical protein